MENALASAFNTAVSTPTAGIKRTRDVDEYANLDEYSSFLAEDHQFQGPDFEVPSASKDCVANIFEQFGTKRPPSSSSRSRPSSRTKLGTRQAVSRMTLCPMSIPADLMPQSQKQEKPNAGRNADSGSSSRTGKKLVRLRRDEDEGAPEFASAALPRPRVSGPATRVAVERLMNEVRFCHRGTGMSERAAALLLKPPSSAATSAAAPRGGLDACAADSDSDDDNVPLNQRAAATRAFEPRGSRTPPAHAPAVVCGAEMDPEELVRLAMGAVRDCHRRGEPHLLPHPR
jgi:hypothetical protein